MPETKPTILAFGPGLWNWPTIHGETRYHLWSLAERGWPVYYVEPPRKWRPAARIWNASDRPFSVLSPPRTIPFAPRFVFGDALSAAWRAVTARQLAGVALRWLRDSGAAPGLVWLGSPWHGALIPHLPPDVPRAYFMYDDLPSSPALTPGQARRLWRWEQDLLRNVGAGIFTSKVIADRRRPHVANAVVVENCVREDFLPENRKPPEPEVRKIIDRIKSIPKPRLLYAGVIDLRLDPRIYFKILEEIPETNLIMMGRTGVKIGKDFLGRLQSDPRVHLLGGYSYDALPHVLPLADVLLLAHLRQPFTDAMYPSKLNEYLASGRPIVAVDMPEIVRTVEESACPNLVYTASSPEEFVACCRRALREEGDTACNKRLDIARQHTFGMGAGMVERALTYVCRGIP